MSSPAEDESNALRQAQVDIAVLKMTVRALLVYFTESKDGRAYDRDKIRNIHKAILSTFTMPHPDDPSGQIYGLLQAQFKNSINDIFINLIED